MSGNGGSRFILVQLHVSDPVESAEPGRFETVLSHPNLTGTLILSHGTDREALLGAVSIDIKQIDPVSALFRNLNEWRTSQQGD